MSEPGLGERITNTLMERTQLRADTITRNSAFLYEIRQRRRLRTRSGGRDISCPTMYGDNGTAGYYHGDETLTFSDDEATTSALYSWKQWSVGVKITGRDVMENSGKNQVIETFAARIEKAEKSLQNLMAAACYADGTGSGGKEIGGAGYLNSASAATGVVGGMDKATVTWWRNKVKATGGVTSSTIYENMLDAVLKTTRGTDAVDLIVADNTYYSTYMLSLRPDLRFSNPRLANAGFTSVEFMEKPVICDGMENGYAPVGMHFLKMDALELTMHTKRNNVPLPGAARRPIDKDVEYVLIAGMGNFISDDIPRHLRMVN